MATVFQGMAMLAALAMLQTAATAAPVLTRSSTQTIDLNDPSFKNKTYLQVTTEASDGIYAKTTNDYTRPQTISGSAPLVGDFALYDPAEKPKVYAYLTQGETTFTTVAGNIAGKNLSPALMTSALSPYLNTNNVKNPAELSQAKTVVGDIVLMGSGAGTLVQITPDDYFYNVSYQAPRTSSGRSYIVTGTRKLLDPSDTYYLGEVGAYMGAASTQEQTNFFTALFNLLTACDTTGVSSVSATGQVVLSDLMGVYTAESMRHYMTGLNVSSNAWEIDVAEVTLLAPYVAASGMVMSNGMLVAGGMKTFAANGHSIGVYEPDYEKLATLITKFENQKKQHPDMIKALNTLTPVKPKSMAKAVKGDIFRQTLVYLNRTEFESGVQSNAGDITIAMVTLENQIRADQAQITAYVKAHQ
jgi:hypothetical protein